MQTEIKTACVNEPFFLLWMCTQLKLQLEICFLFITPGYHFLVLLGLSDEINTVSMFLCILGYHRLLTINCMKVALNLTAQLTKFLRNFQ